MKNNATTLAELIHEKNLGREMSDEERRAFRETTERKVQSYMESLTPERRKAAEEGREMLKKMLDFMVKLVPSQKVEQHAEGCASDEKRLDPDCPLCRRRQSEDN